MYKKAMMFGDIEIANRILNTTSPKDQKAFGRLVKNFDAEKWDAVCQDVVFEGCLAKFSQNPTIKQTRGRSELC